MTTDNLRYQDAVARVAGINLKSTVRVMRAIALVALSERDDALAQSLDAVLEQGARNDGEASALDDKPTEEAVAACNDVFDRLIARFGWDRVRALQTLEGCPYLAQALDDSRT